MLVENYSVLLDLFILNLKPHLAMLGDAPQLWAQQSLPGALGSKQNQWHFAPELFRAMETGSETIRIEGPWLTMYMG